MNNDTGTQTLESATETGQPVRRRLATPLAVRTVCDRLDTADESDAYRRAIIQGMIDGNPPYDQKTLEDAGLGTLTNVNFGSMAASLNARACAAFELLAEVPTLVEITPSYPDPKSPDQLFKCAIVQEEFSRMVQNWTGFLPMTDLAVRETDAYGVGPVMFKDTWDWRPRAFKRGNLRVEPRAKVVVDDNDIVVIRDEYTAGELFAVLEDEEAARAAGWKVEYLKDLLGRVFGKNEKANKDTQDIYQRSIWESIQQAWRNNDPVVQAKEFEKIQIRHVLVKEVYGDCGVTHVIITEGSNFDYFLFEKVNRFEAMSQVVWWLLANYGDGYLKSIRGIASWMAKHDDLGNRFLCRTFDAGFLVSGMVLQSQSAIDMSRLQFLQHGPWTILPPELNAVQSTFTPQVAQLLQLREVSQNIMKNDTGTYKRYDEVPDHASDRKTARQVVEEVSKEQRYEKSDIAFRYQHFDALYAEMFRRAVSATYVNSSIELPGLVEVKAFFKRCEIKGVKKGELVGKADNYIVKATRAIGLGSLGVKYDLTNQVLNMRPLLDDIGQRQALRDWLAARVGYRNVDRYAPAVSRDMVPSNEVSMAVLENNDLSQGQQAQAGSDQLQKVHIQTHIQGVIMPILQAASEGAVQDPIKAHQALTASVAHVGQHLQFVTQDPVQGEFVKSVQQVLQQAQDIMSGLESAIQRQQQQMQQQAQQQQAAVSQAEQVLKDRELEAKIYEIQKKAELELMKQNSFNEVRRIKIMDQQDIARTRAERDSTRQDAVATAEIRRADAKAEAERARQETA